MVQVVATLLLIAVVPAVVPAIPSLARSSSLTLLTREREVSAQVAATAADVRAGLAVAEGKTITRTRRIEPVSVYFEEGVVRVDPANPQSPKTGKGLFRPEVYLLSLLGFDVAGFTSAHLLTTRYLVDFLLPVIILVAMSLLTAPTDPARLARFYVRMKTPVAASLEADAAEVERSYAKPTRFDHLKLFPNSNWEFTRWDKTDTLGFLVSCAMVGLVLLVFKAVLVVGS